MCGGANQLRTNMSEGYAWLFMDKNGFNNSKENQNKAETLGVDILIMGSSHMEAAEVSANENLGSILNEKISDKNTYNIGISGHDIYRVMDNVEKAYETYQPRDFLVIETDAVELEMDEMDKVLQGTAKKIPSYDSGLIYHVQKIPAFKWLYKSLEN